jgi:hypothetical protein
MRLKWLGQTLVATVIPSAPVRTYEPPLGLWAVQAYRFTGGTWQKLSQYDQFFTNVNDATRYYQDLCRRGRSISGTTVVKRSLFSSTVRNVPVVVKLLMRVRDRYVVNTECSS